MKRFLVVTILAIVISYPAQAATEPQAGWLVKADNSPTVYFINDFFEREPFVSAQSYYSWYQDFRHVHVAPADELKQFRLGQWRTIKPQSLIKSAVNPKVYIVDMPRVIKHIPSEEVARGFFGENWAQKVITVSQGELNLYYQAEPLNSSTQSKTISSVAEAESVSLQAVSKAVSYLQRQSLSWWTAMAMAAAGQPVDKSQLPIIANDDALTSKAKAIIALAAMSHDPANYQGRDLVSELISTSSHGQLGGQWQLNDDAWGILALRSAGYTANDEYIQDSAQYLKQQQNDDGGWSFATTIKSDSNDTAIVLVALLESGLTKTDSAIQRGLQYLRSTQNTDGGFGFYPNSQSDGESTAWVLSFINRYGEGLNNWQKNGQTPQDFLLSLQSEKGFFKRTPQSIANNNRLTAYSIVALNNQWYIFNYAK